MGSWVSSARLSWQGVDATVDVMRELRKEFGKQLIACTTGSNRIAFEDLKVMQKACKNTGFVLIAPRRERASYKAVSDYKHNNAIVADSTRLSNARVLELSKLTKEIYDILSNCEPSSKSFSENVSRLIEVSERIYQTNKDIGFSPEGNYLSLLTTSQQFINTTFDICHFAEINNKKVKDLLN